MRDALWIPDEARAESSEMHKYMKYVNRRFFQSFHTYKELYDWSVNNIEEFWASLWDYFDIISSEPYTAVFDDMKKFPGCQ